MALSFKLTEFPAIVLATDEAGRRWDVPSTDPSYVAWLQGGNTPAPADPPAVRFQDGRAIVARVRTTNATATEVYRATLATNRGYAGSFLLIGVDAGNGAVKIIRASIAAKRLAAGALLVGTPVLYATHNDTAAAGWTAGANVQGNDFVVTVTGANGRTIDWNLTGDVVQFAPSGL